MCLSLYITELVKKGGGSSRRWMCHEPGCPSWASMHLEHKLLASQLKMSCLWYTTINLLILKPLVHTSMCACVAVFCLIARLSVCLFVWLFVNLCFVCWNSCSVTLSSSHFSSHGFSLTKANHFTSVSLCPMWSIAWAIAWSTHSNCLNQLQNHTLPVWSRELLQDRRVGVV